jgi:hypothetical protein
VPQSPDADGRSMLAWLSFAVLGAVALFGGHAAGRRWRRAAASAVPLLLVALVLRLAFDLRPDWEWAVFPQPGYAGTQSVQLYVIGAAFFGLAAARLSVRWNRVVVVAVGALVLAHGLERHRWLAWPEVHGDERTAGADHHVRQSTHYTCGPAACVAALSHCGIVATERGMAAACGARPGGTRLFDLYRGLVTVLAEQPFRVGIESLDERGLCRDGQVLVGSNAGGGHALCVANVGGRHVLHDPRALAPQVLTAAELVAVMRGPFVVVRPAVVGAAVAPMR